MLDEMDSLVRLRPFEKGDEDAVVSYLGDLSVTRWLARVPHPFGREDLRLFDDAGGSRWPGLVAIEFDGALVGGASTDTHLGYWIGRPHWGQGIATRAARAAVDLCFEAPDRSEIRSGHFKGNEASRKILSGLGFQKIEENMLECRALGKAMPNVDLVLTRESWETRHV